MNVVIDEAAHPASGSRSKVLRRRAKLQFDERTYMDAEATSVSLRGMSLIVPRKIAEQRDCSVHMRILEGSDVKILSAVGRVASCSLAGMEGFRVALRFTDLQPESAIMIGRLLGSNGRI